MCGNEKVDADANANADADGIHTKNNIMSSQTRGWGNNIRNSRYFLSSGHEVYYFYNY